MPYLTTTLVSSGNLVQVLLGLAQEPGRMRERDYPATEGAMALISS